MKWDEHENLCWIMRWGWMTWKWSLAFNNDDGKTLYKTNKSKKNKKTLVFPSCHPSSSSVHVPFPEIEIKRQLREIFQLLTRTTFWDSKLQTIIYTDLSLSALINHLACLSLSLHALHSSSSFSLASSCSFLTLLHSALLKI